jgi:tripartite-type tricarboxylate transporter receptor subunit TctC
MSEVRSAWRRRELIGAGVALFGSVAGGNVLSQNKWPEKPIKLVVGFPPGGATDVVARIISQPLSEVLGTSVVIDNRPGAASNIAMTEVARAPADGYTILVAPTTIESANPFLYKASANPATDLIAVAGLCRFQLHMVVRNGFPAKDVAELIAYAKKNPGKMSYSSAGAGTTPHLIGELFLQQAGIQVVHVPYKGSAPAMQAVLTGEVDFVMDPGISFQHVRAGKASMFAVASPTRSKQFPEVSTLGEKGVPGIDYDTWAGVWTPVGTPEDARTRLSRAISQVMALPDVQQKMQALSGESMYMDSSQYRQMLNKETAAFSGVIKNRKIILE